MINAADRVYMLSPYEIHAIASELKECKCFGNLIEYLKDDSKPLEHVDQAEIRTMFAHHELPISTEEIKPACTAILDRFESCYDERFFAEQIFPQEIG